MPPACKCRSAAGAAHDVGLAVPALTQRLGGLSQPALNWSSSSSTGGGSATGEPHAARRRAILAAHGARVRALYGPDPSAALQTAVVWCLHLGLAAALSSSPWWKVGALAYLAGGWASQHLFLAIHELSHRLVFRAPTHNRAAALAANLAVVVPMAVSFRKYHLDHHAHQGVEGLDVDLPTRAEAAFARGPARKAAWLAVQALVYAGRPLCVNAKPLCALDYVNLVTVLIADAAVLFLLGPRALVYLAVSVLAGGGLHPAAGHFIAEHYVVPPPATAPDQATACDQDTAPDEAREPDQAAPRGAQETYSYYGPLNCLMYNVGFHVEHHDFPQIAAARLPALRAAAPEFYSGLVSHKSWAALLWRYVWDQALGPWSRVRRGAGGGAPRAVPDQATRHVAAAARAGVPAAEGALPDRAAVRRADSAVAVAEWPSDSRGGAGETAAGLEAADSGLAGAAGAVGQAPAAPAPAAAADATARAAGHPAYNAAASLEPDPPACAASLAQDAVASASTLESGRTFIQQAGDGGPPSGWSATLASGQVVAPPAGACRQAAMPGLAPGGSSWAAAR